MVGHHSRLAHFECGEALGARYQGFHSFNDGDRHDYHPLCALACVVLAASFLLVAEYRADPNTRSAISRSVDGDRVAQHDDSGNAQAPAPAAAPDTGSGDDDDSKSPGQNQE